MINALLLFRMSMTFCGNRSAIFIFSEFPKHFFDNVDIAKEIKGGRWIMQPLIGLGRIENVQGTLT